MTKYKCISDLVSYAKTMTQEDVDKIGASISYLRLVGYGHKQLSAKTATQLELHTQGCFKREILRKDWRLIWPELIELKRV